MIANPFIITGEYISKDYFCDRDFETGVITSNILNGRNTVLISPRRMGKTGLISHVLNQDEIKNNYRSFTIDLYSTSSLAEMVMMLSKEIIQKNKSKGEKTLTSFIQGEIIEAWSENRSGLRRIEIRSLARRNHTAIQFHRGDLRLPRTAGATLYCGYR